MAAKLVLVIARGQTVNNVTIAINNQNQTPFLPDATLGGLPGKDLGNLFAAGLVAQHTLAIIGAGDLGLANPVPGDQSAIDDNKLLDVLLYVEYKIR